MLAPSLAALVAPPATELGPMREVEAPEVTSITPEPRFAVVSRDEITSRLVAAVLGAGARVCVSCGSPLPPRPAGPGRPRRTCSCACRKAPQRRRDRSLPEWWPRSRPGGRAPLALRSPGMHDHG